MENADVDRWVPNWEGVGLTREQAEKVAARAQELQDADPDADWVQHLDQAARELCAVEESPWIVGFSGVPVVGAGAMRSPVFEWPVVGFSGMPAAEGAGVLAPVFESPEGFFFMGDPDAIVPARSRWTNAQLLEFEQHGSIYRTKEPWRRVPGGVILYAHEAFVFSKANSFDLKPLCNRMIFDERLHCYIQYLPREKALSQLKDWATALIKDADDQLAKSRETDWERALESAERAKLVTPRPELQTLHEQAIVLLGAAWIVLEKNFDDILWDAATEDDPKLLSVVKTEAPELAEKIRFAAFWKAQGL
jgi:hypothetical protein